MVFPVVMYGCESWTIKKTECWRNNSFELWCWKRLLRVPWIARRSNQSTPKEISPDYSLEGLMLKLKLQHFGHLMGRTDSLEKTLMLGITEGGRGGDDRGWNGWMASLTQCMWVWVASRSWYWTRKSGILQYMGSQRAGHDWATELNIFCTYQEIQNIIVVSSYLFNEWTDEWINKQEGKWSAMYLSQMDNVNDND